MIRPIIFLGESRQITEIKETCDLLGLPVKGIIDKDFYGNSDGIDGVPFIAAEDDVDWLDLKKSYDFFVAINPVPGVPRNVAKRKNFIKIVDQYNLPCVNIIDPQARVSRSCILGKGVFVGFGAYVSPHVTIGDHCQLHYLAGVMHDCQIGRNVMLNRAVGIISGVTVGDNVYMAPFSRVLNAKTIGSDSVINSGVLIFRDIEPGEIVKITSKKVYASIDDLPKDA